ncbi:putative L-ascorbate peroxidase 6 isoform X2 [Abrus precatorius]|uniref:L-ascorbate peroxidase n=1 Tax=Abrus precatorius TaxID=3816 RepID=A0A8B8LFD5_ABRPR|nr:putative L-ascorbate peroxidase 6 isoform X2 [Abrus precatorius]
MMSSALTNHLVQCSIATTSNTKTHFPAKLHSSSFSTIKLRPDNPNHHASSDLAVPRCSRRGLIYIATLPCLIPLTQIIGSLRANAKQAVTNEYLLIKEEVRKVLSKGKAAGVLRLVFHDAGTFDIDENTVDLSYVPQVLQKAKTQIDAIQPVSWADMIAVAGAEAVEVCGGPPIQVSLGRLDSLVPDPEGRLPEESLNASGLKKCFQRKGFSTQELVALSGAHTIGGKGFGSPISFDNSYYKVLLEKPWTSSGGMSSMIGLPSDHALVEDDECLRWIKKYADNENTFFEDFKNAYVKLVNSGVRWNSL